MDPLTDSIVRPNPAPQRLPLPTFILARISDGEGATSSSAAPLQLCCWLRRRGSRIIHRRFAALLRGCLQRDLRYETRAAGLTHRLQLIIFRTPRLDLPSLSTAKKTEGS